MSTDEFKRSLPANCDLLCFVQDDDGLNDTTPSTLADTIMNTHASSTDGYLAQNEYLVWTVDHQLPTYFLDLLYQVRQTPKLFYLYLICQIVSDRRKI